MKAERQTGRLVLDALLAALMVVAIVDARSLPDQARFMPTFIAGMTLLFLAFGIVMEAFPATRRYLTAKTPRSDPRVTQQAEEPAEWSAALKVITLIVTFWALVFFFGFYLVPPILVAAYLVYEGDVRPLVAIGCAVAATLLTLFGLDILGVQPWIGAGPEILEGYIGGAVMPLF